jgi:hypothetical protein
MFSFPSLQHGVVLNILLSHSWFHSLKALGQVTNCQGLHDLQFREAASCIGVAKHFFLHFFPSLFPRYAGYYSFYSKKVCTLSHIKYSLGGWQDQAQDLLYMLANQYNENAMPSNSA